MMKRLGLLIGAALWLACPGPVTPDAGGSGGGGGLDGGSGGGGGGTSGTVVLITDRHLTSAGVTTARSSQVGSTLRAHLPIGDAGYLVVTGAWTDGGVGSFSSAFPGDWLLEFDQGRFVQVSGTSIDLGSEVLGRPNVAYAEATPLTTVRSRVNFNKAYSAYDDVQLILPNTGGSVFEANYYGVAEPDGGFSRPEEGQTSVDWTLDWSGLPLIDPAQGDTLIATHLSYGDFQTLGDAGFIWQRVLSSTLVPAPFAVTQGMGALLSGTFSPVPQDNTVGIDWRRAEINALRPQVSPTAKIVDEAYYVSVIPFSSAHGLYAEAPDLCVVQTYGEPQRDVARTLTFANPYPPAWSRLGGTFATFEVPLDLGGGQGSSLRLSVAAVDLLSRFVNSPQGVRLSPPRNLRIDGQQAEAAVTLSTLTPVVSWDAPDVGPAERYSVQVSRLLPSDSAQVASLIVPASVQSVALPSGLLTSGQPYAVVVYAWRDGQVPTASEPFHTGFPFAQAATVSGVLRAP